MESWMRSVCLFCLRLWKRCADLAALRRAWPDEGRTRQSRRRQGAEKWKSGRAVDPCSDEWMEYLPTFTIKLTHIFHTWSIWDGEFAVPQTINRARYRIFLNLGCSRFTHFLQNASFHGSQRQIDCKTVTMEAWHDSLWHALRCIVVRWCDWWVAERCWWLDSQYLEHWSTARIFICLRVFSMSSRFFSLPEVKKPKTLSLQKPKKPWMPTWTCLAKWRSRIAEPENQSAMTWFRSANRWDTSYYQLFVLTIVVVWYFDICLILSLCNSVRILEFVTQMDPPDNSACAWPGSPVRKSLFRFSAFFFEVNGPMFSLSSNRHEPWQFLRLTCFGLSKFWIQI